MEYCRVFQKKRVHACLFARSIAQPAGDTEALNNNDKSCKALYGMQQPRVIPFPAYLNHCPHQFRRQRSVCWQKHGANYSSHGTSRLHKFHTYLIRELSFKGPPVILTRESNGATWARFHDKIIHPASDHENESLGRVSSCEKGQPRPSSSQKPTYIRRSWQMRNIDLSAAGIKIPFPNSTFPYPINSRI